VYLALIVIGICREVILAVLPGVDVRSVMPDSLLSANRLDHFTSYFERNTHYQRGMTARIAGALRHCWHPWSIKDLHALVQV
jgi:hypothetical protein